MPKNILLATLFGGIVMMVWLTISNAMIPIKSQLIHNVPPNQLELHKTLKESITEPGTYSCPYLSREDEHLLEDYRNQPVYSITYSGFTHGTGSGAGMVTPIIVIFVVAFIAAWMLSKLSPQLLSSYWRKVLFVVAIGLLVALSDDILQMSFGPQPKDYLVFLAINNVVTWTLGGLVIAGRIKPTQ